LNGLILDSETLEPIIGATISDATKNKPLAISDAEGRFRVPNNRYKQLKISYIGYKQLITSISKDGRYLLQSEISKIGEVVVTAQEGRGLATSSKIEKHAMEHLQPSSFADLLELLPGGRALNPSLTTPNTINLREATTRGGNYSTSSLGTRFVMDGAPISTNANMQYLSGAWETQATSRDFTNAGVDMRSISTDEIQSVEVVRGIPSVEYGDLTSGLVKIERKKGGHDLNFRLKSDMGSKLFYVAKGLEWKERKLSLNLSADYLNAKEDPRNRLENYKRVTFSARLNKTWERKNFITTLSTNIDYTGSFDNDKEDPDLNNHGEDSYKSQYNRIALMASLNLKMKRQTWLKNIDIAFSGSYEHDLIERTRLVQLQRMQIAATTKEEGESDAVILPYTYVASHSADGKPLNLFLKANARFQVPSRFLVNSLLVGVDWNLDKNLGDGQVFDPLRPLYPGMSARQRKLSDIPANRTFSFYAEENLKMPLLGGSLELVAGVRGQRMLNLPSNYEMHGTVYFDPRFNIGWTFPKFTVFHQPTFIRISTGWGMHTKNPTMEQLFPDKVYMDLVQLNYYHDNPDYRRINLRTYIRDTSNPNLKPARNKKWEISTDINIGGHRLSVTYFRENMTSGFRSMASYAPYTYKKYDTSGIDAATLTSQPDIATLPYQEKQELLGLGMYSNGSQTLKQGVEYTLETKRFPVILTRLTINGAYFRTTYRNSQLETYRPSQVIDGEQIQYVGYYKDDDGSVYERMNTNFTLDTDVPKLKLGFSVSAQFLWFTTQQQNLVSNYPDQYMSPDGTMHDWQEGDEEDTYLRWLVRHNTESMFEKQRVPMSMNLNFKVTKKLLRDRLKIAMFCNKIWDYTPDYESNGVTIHRHVKAYFGLEMNVKL
jgi:outer membrane receptor protein involved in Fe transport